jgi:tRNA threonylcarbamoyl adenosine modification protein (Sua5/YciO/YrdC/YwlC family)
MSLEYIIPENIDDRILARTADILRSGGLVAYPTDTTWSIGCSSESKDGLERLSALHGKGEKFPFTLICSSIRQMSSVSRLDDVRFRFIKRYVPGPYVFVLPPALRIERLINVKRPEVGVRLPSHPVPVRIVETLGTPMFSITAKRSLAAGTAAGSWAESESNEYFEMGWELEDLPGVELVLDAGEAILPKLSTVVDLTGDEPVVLRRGIGPIEL